MNKTDIARACHEANRALCETYGDYSQVSWDMAPAWQKKAMLEGIEFHLSGTRTPEETHENWAKQKQKEGWTYGPKKDPRAMTHPCLVPYDKLPPMQKAKDAIIAALVQAMKNGLTE
jgi:hypothetical protein